MNKLSKFLPSLDKVTQEVIAVAISTIVVAWIVSRNPALKALVRDYQSPN